jgi:sugar (pentulose or hexulose) kinase
MDFISIIVGGSRSLYWGSILSNTLNRTLYYHNESSFGPAFGAVRLSIYEDTSKPLEEVFYQPTISNKVEPVGKESENLQKKAEIYSESYQKLKYIYKSIGA